MKLAVQTLRISRASVAVLASLLGVAGCDKPQALGDVNAIIVALPDEQWPQVQAAIETALEPRAFTVRDERIFRVAQVDPTGPYWGDTRRFRQVLLIGEPGDEWIAQTLQEAGQQPAQLPAVVQAQNVWARGQRVTALVLPPGAPATDAQPLIPEVGASLMQAYQTFIRQRMFASGADTARADSLQREAGFYLLTPAVYRVQQLDANTLHFINDQPDPSQLQRSVLVARRASADVTLVPERLFAWREELARQHYYPAQVTHSERIEQRELTADGVRGLELQGVWSSSPGAWPAGGPFLARAVECPDGHTYLLDGWVYAPGREKYEYLFQVHTILESFRCGS